MKETYSRPEMEIEIFDVVDVITESIIEGPLLPGFD